MSSFKSVQSYKDIVSTDIKSARFYKYIGIIVESPKKFS